MKDFLESNLGQLIARSGILGVFLAWSMYVNHGLTEKLFSLIENNTRAFQEMKSALESGLHR